MNPTNVCLGYGYNDGLVSDAGYGLLGTQTTTVLGHTLRAGKNLSTVQETANMVAFGSSNDNRGVSAALDNMLSTEAPKISSKNLRFAGQFQFGFADGHAKLIPIRSAEVAGWGTTAIPANKNDAYKWCFDQNFVPDAQFATLSFPSAHPIHSGKLTCAQAVDDMYQYAVINP